MLAWEWPLPAMTALALYSAALAGSWGVPRGPHRPSEPTPKNQSFRLCARSFLSSLPPILFLVGPAFCLGIITIHLLHPQPNSRNAPEQIVDHRDAVEITGRVAEVRSRPGNHFQIILDDVHLHPSTEEMYPLGGRLLWNWQSPPHLPSPGHDVRAVLRIRPIQGMANPGMSRSEEYWARQDIRHRAYSREDKVEAHFSGPGSTAWDKRLRIRNALLDSTPAGQGQAMLLALLMGERSLLHPETMDIVQRASLAHSLALSGMHLGFVVSLGWLAALALGWVWPSIHLSLPRPKLAVLLSIPLVLGYVWLGQAVPSLLRAALMFGSWGLLLLCNRRRVLLDGLFLALLVILVLSPMTVFDLRLQLSVLAVAGLALIWPLGREALHFSRRSWWQKPFTVAAGILAVSMVATLALLPLQAWFFGRISPHLHLNVLWLPMLGLIVFPLGLAGLLLVLLPGGTVAAGPVLTLACTVLETMLAGLHFLDAAGWLWITIPARPHWPQFLGYWILPLAAVAWWKCPLNIRPGVIATAIFLLITPTLQNIYQEQRPGVSLRMLDVGQGLSVLLELPGGKRWLMDGGGFWTWDFDLGRAIIAPVLTHGRPPWLSGIALSHADFDHYRGLYYPLRHFRVGKYASQGKDPEDQDGLILQEILSGRKIARDVWKKGDIVRLDADIILEVLHPDQKGWLADKDNDTSLVLRLVWKGRPLALLTGDIEHPSIFALLRDTENDPDKLRAEVLLVPHHGSRTSHFAPFYAQVQPRIALVSSGFLNRFNHPHPEVVESFQELGVPLLNTADHGAITVFWNSPAARPEVLSERQGRLDLSARR